MVERRNPPPSPNKHIIIREGVVMGGLKPVTSHSWWYGPTSWADLGAGKKHIFVFYKSNTARARASSFPCGLGSGLQLQACLKLGPGIGFCFRSRVVLDIPRPSPAPSMKAPSFFVFSPVIKWQAKFSFYIFFFFFVERMRWFFKFSIFRLDPLSFYPLLNYPFTLLRS